MCRLHRSLGGLVLLVLASCAASDERLPSSPPNDSVVARQRGVLRSFLRPRRLYSGTSATIQTPLASADRSDAWSHRLREPRTGGNVRVNGDSTYLPQNEPSIAWSPARPETLLIGANDYRLFPGDLSVGAYASIDAGHTFTIDGLLPALTVATGGTYEGAGDPALACSAEGDCYYAALAFDFTTTRSAVAVSHTADGGHSWDAPTFVVADDGTTVSHDKPWIAVDNSSGPRRGTVYVTWTRITFTDAGDYVGSPIYFSSSRDRGHTWSGARQVSSDELPYNQGSRPVVDRHGRLYVVYESAVPDDPLRNQQLIQWSDDVNNYFSSPIQIDYVHDTPSPIPPAKYRTDSFPAIAANPLDGTLHVVWSDNRSGHSDILLSSSADQGRTWTRPLRVNDTPPDRGAEHVFPAVACGPLGQCGISFYSNRNDRQSGVLLDVYYASLPARHVEAGKCCPLRNVRVSDRSSDPNVQFDGEFIGDYIDLVISKRHAHLVWTDTRVREIDQTGTLVHQQDIFSARIPLTDRGD